MRGKPFWSLPEDWEVRRELGKAPKDALLPPPRQLGLKKLPLCPSLPQAHLSNLGEVLKMPGPQSRGAWESGWGRGTEARRE